MCWGGPPGYGGGYPPYNGPPGGAPAQSPDDAWQVNITYHCYHSYVYKNNLLRSSRLRMAVSTTSMQPLNRIHGRSHRHLSIRKVSRLFHCCDYSSFVSFNIHNLQLTFHLNLLSYYTILARESSASAPNPAHLIAQQALAAVTGMGGGGGMGMGGGPAPGVSLFDRTRFKAR